MARRMMYEVGRRCKAKRNPRPQLCEVPRCPRNLEAIMGSHKHKASFTSTAYHDTLRPLLKIGWGPKQAKVAAQVEYARAGQLWDDAHPDN